MRRMAALIMLLAVMTTVFSFEEREVWRTYLDSTTNNVVTVARDERDFKYDVRPQFPGGTEKMKAYFKEKVRYPNVAYNNGIQGYVYVDFVVKANGCITDVILLNLPRKELADDVVRIIKNMPCWQPATYEGKPVDASYTIYFYFRLKDIEGEEKVDVLTSNGTHYLIQVTKTPYTMSDELDL